VKTAQAQQVQYPIPTSAVEVPGPPPGTALTKEQSPRQGHPRHC